MKAKKSWKEKMANSKGLPKFITLQGRFAVRWGEGLMVVPAPLEVDAIMRTVPKGKLTTIDNIRTALTKKHRVNVCCPITTGIFAWMAAHAAEEAMAAGEKKVTPYWRTLKTKGELNQKYPGGVEELKRKLIAEGHLVIARRKRMFVDGFEKKLV